MLADGYNKHKVKSSWKDLVGAHIDAATQEISFSDRKMFVKVKSSIVRSEIMLIRNQLVYRVNNFIGTNIIDEIIVR
ncbi:MAG: DUF721 domain-containing protein [Bacteroidales bacterium]|nr:DUF721 domain-containing protein [Bacteroidales bacterium]